MSRHLESAAKITFAYSAFEHEMAIDVDHRNDVLVTLVQIGIACYVIFIDDEVVIMAQFF
jgi:hypothetical protein